MKIYAIKWIFILKSNLKCHRLILSPSMSFRIFNFCINLCKQPVSQSAWVARPGLALPLTEASFCLGLWSCDWRAIALVAYWRVSLSPFPPLVVSIYTCRVSILPFIHLMRFFVSEYSSTILSSTSAGLLASSNPATGSISSSSSLPLQWSTFVHLPVQLHPLLWHRCPMPIIHFTHPQTCRIPSSRT